MRPFFPWKFCQLLPYEPLSKSKGLSPADKAPSKVQRKMQEQTGGGR